MRSLKKEVEKLNYMQMNTVKPNLVAHPRDWPWSSFSFYARKGAGLTRIDPMSCSGVPVHFKSPALQRAKDGAPQHQLQSPGRPSVALQLGVIGVADFVEKSYRRLVPSAWRYNPEDLLWGKWNGYKHRTLHHNNVKGCGASKF